jgi:hypothetical protein
MTRLKKNTMYEDITTIAIKSQRIIQATQLSPYNITVQKKTMAWHISISLLLDRNTLTHAKSNNKKIQTKENQHDDTTMNCNKTKTTTQITKINSTTRE